jgi:hypothetical protein
LETPSIENKQLTRLSRSVLINQFHGVFTILLPFTS